MAKARDIMLYERGTERSFHCGCGCNVFHQPESRSDVYECNACGAWYVDAGAAAILAMAETLDEFFAEGS